VLTKKDVEVEFSIGDPLQPLLKNKASADDAEISESIELKAGVPYHYKLEARNLGDGHVSLSIEGEKLSRGSLARLTLYQVDSFDLTSRALVLLEKTFDLIQRLKLNEREIRYVQSHAAAFDNFKLSDLPVTDSVSSALSSKLFLQFLRLANYGRLKSEMGIAGNELISAFEIAEQGNPGALCKRIAEIIRRDDGTIRAMADYFG